jgi:small ligand-binding sensory domain FIST
VAEHVEVGMQLAFCRRDVEAARRDLVRVCSEIREELAETLPAVAAVADSTPLDPVQRVAGALYVSCSGRGGAHFGGPSAELQIIQHALGDVPLAGFFAAGEIGHHHLYGYTGVLTVFVREP